MASEREIAQQTQEKFQFYALSLVFTLLALSVQTANFDESKTTTVLELVGWAALVLCAIAFLSKMEWESSNRMQMAKIDEIERNLGHFIQAQAGGQQSVTTQSGAVLPIATLIANHQDALNKARKHFQKLERRDVAKYLLSRVAFITGLVAIILARSLQHAVDLFGYKLL
jgi:K+ transporter